MAEVRDIAHAEFGANVLDDGVRYRTWAPEKTSANVIVSSRSGSRTIGLERESGGFWSVKDPHGEAGDLYHFSLDGGPPLPDIASRFQPSGVDGPSECIDSRSYPWRCGAWRRPRWIGQSIYEIHVGAMTPSGNFKDAAEKLSLLRDLGIDAIEIMPIADFAGDRNWGYDGVALFAPARCYGRPDDLRLLVDQAHACGIAVVLDVVYNHAGPKGSYLERYCESFFHQNEHTPWGRTFNFDGINSGPVRDFFLSNAAYWMDEFRIDGLRLDATHAIPDTSPRHILSDITDMVHARDGFVIAEDERNSAAILKSTDHGGYGFDAAWADDFHHQLRVALTGVRKSYFTAYSGSTADVVDTLKNGWSYRGAAYPPWNGRSRGSECAQLPASAFIHCIENHDQIGNRRSGERLEHIISPEAFRAASMLLCLGPYPPLLFMGQEWAASTPFLFFCNHEGDLGRQILEGRKREFAAEHADSAAKPHDDPEAQSTFKASILNWDERTMGEHGNCLRLYSECLRERRTMKRLGLVERHQWQACAIGETIFVHYRLESQERMLVVNLGGSSMSEDALPTGLQPASGRWRLVMDSNDPSYGGHSASNAVGWTTQGPSALWLVAP